MQVSILYLLPAQILSISICVYITKWWHVCRDARIERNIKLKSVCARMCVGGRGVDAGIDLKFWNLRRSHNTNMRTSCILYIQFLVCLICWDLPQVAVERVWIIQHTLVFSLHLDVFRYLLKLICFAFYKVVLLLYWFTN